MTLHSLVSDDPKEPLASLISADVREVVELFDGGVLTGLAFPDIDKETFDSLIAEVRDNASNVEEIRQLLAEGRESLATAEAALSKRAETALAYARVYAATDPELTAKLDELTLSQRQASRAKPRRRRRKSAASKPEAPAEKTAELPLIAVG